MHDIIIAVIGCGVLNVLVTAIANALSSRKSRLKGIEDTLGKIDGRLAKTEKDALRTQLLLMISDYPTNTEGIMQLGERYFGGLHGNWYATTIFNRWLEERKIAKPEWFKEDA